MKFLHVATYWPYLRGMDTSCMGSRMRPCCGSPTSRSWPSSACCATVKRGVHPLVGVMTDSDLIARAMALVCPRRLSPKVEAGGVGCALVTATGALHVGVCMDAACGLGFCAEQAAIASMITHGESRIDTIVAVRGDGMVLPPCG